LKNVFSNPQEYGVEDRAIRRTLRARGFRLTSQRLAIIKVLLEADEHLTPAEVLERGQNVCPGLGLTTVYRTLEVLRESGWVRRVHLDEGCQAYALLREKEAHHLVCQGCHRVVDFPCTGLTELVEETTRRTGFTVQSHLLELVGLCPDCQGADVPVDVTESAGDGAVL
jgi:Fur family ferric uptake transcriptional regulator